MPSKLIAMMLSGKPSFLYGNPLSESKLIVEESRGGIFYSGDNVNEFFTKNHQLFTERQKEGINGKCRQKIRSITFLGQ